MDIEDAGTVVRSVHNPAKVGVSTGRLSRLYGMDYLYVRYPSGEEEPIPVEELEIAPSAESRAIAFTNSRFSAPGAVARAIITEKIRGQLTDVIYAMGSGKATFFPHQFKPVLTFLSSTVGRILIADEVGLGKTVEAIYIWRELQARTAARRLLVVCPAVLRTKWQDELRERFSIDASIVTASSLLELTRDAVRDPTKSFFAIAGLESIRARRVDTEEGSRRSARADLAKFLLAHEASAEFAPFDLVIVDEAHYLRNPETANHQTGQLLAAAAAHLVLLTATPIQIGSENLFNLLRLVDPDRFLSFESFEGLRRANALVTRALNAVRRTPCDWDDFSDAIKDMARSRFFRTDALIQGWREAPPDFTSYDERTRVARLLEERSLLSSVLTRTRKRDVIEDRVIREPMVRRIRLSASERAIYDNVTQTLRQKAYGSDTVNTLALIARQRQLASSIPAALANWRSNPSTTDLLAEDLGYVIDEDELGRLRVDDLPAVAAGLSANTEMQDTKFADFFRFLRTWLAEHPSDKIIVFSFFRATLRYLERRLRSEGLSTAIILGGMGEAKHEEITRFADPRGPNILLSSEVGSEGLDLQFSGVVVNYDLPWNPMRVEQRIGRIDRLGQKSEKIKIVSFVIEDTIEELILDRLYKRIRIFEESIGDMEEILGEPIDDLVIEYFRDGLSEEQIAQRLEQSALATAEHRRAVQQLEDEAPELAGSMDFILSSIQNGREAGRWIRPDDLRKFLCDFLLENYPGSRLEADRDVPGLYHLLLSPAAGAAFTLFFERTRPHRGTQLRVPGAEVPVVFDVELHTKLRPRSELLDITHPIVTFIRDAAAERTTAAEPIAAVVVPGALAGITPGVYVFATDYWRLDGLRRDVRLQSLVSSVPIGEVLETSLGDRLIDVALQRGSRIDASLFSDVHQTLVEAFIVCERELEHRFLAERHAFKQENRRRVEQARLLVHDRSAARLQQLNEQLYQQRRSPDDNRRRAAQMTQGRIKKLEADRDQRLARIEATEETITTRRAIAGGIIIVEGSDV